MAKHKHPGTAIGEFFENDEVHAGQMMGEPALLSIIDQCRA
jgi:hypothetical protein